MRTGTAARSQARWAVLRLATWAVVAATVLATAATLATGQWLIRPAAREVGPPPAELPALALKISVPEGGMAPHVAGWFVRGQPGAGAVLLLHGVRSDRRQMLPRARWLHGAGIATLLIDLPAHGESPGEHIGLGALEGPAVRAALAELRRRAPGERVALIGVSLGAAAYVLAGAEPPADAVVLESMYASIEAATAHRIAIRLGGLSHLLAEPLLWQLPWRLGLGRDELRPIDHRPRLRAPLLLISGSADRHTLWVETEALFAAAREPKQLWQVPGAEHVDLFAFEPTAYAARVLPFLQQHLQPALPR